MDTTNSHVGLKYYFSNKKTIGHKGYEIIIGNPSRSVGNEDRYIFIRGVMIDCSDYSIANPLEILSENNAPNGWNLKRRSVSWKEEQSTLEIAISNTRNESRR